MSCRQASRRVCRLQRRLSERNLRTTSKSSRKARMFGPSMRQSIGDVSRAPRQTGQMSSSYAHPGKPAPCAKNSTCASRYLSHQSSTTAQKYAHSYQSSATSTLSGSANTPQTLPPSTSKTSPVNNQPNAYLWTRH
jgi:hypothetical protein